MARETIIKISRGKYTEDSISEAILTLDNMYHYSGVMCMVNYYTSQLHDKFDTVFACGVKDGKGRDCYRIISLWQDNIIWGASNTLPDVSNLVHGERYLYVDSAGDWWIVSAPNGETRQIVAVPKIPTIYTNITDNCQWVVDYDGKARRITDIYNKSEIDSLFEEAINTVRYIDFDELTPTQIELLRGHKGDQGDKGDPGPIGLQGISGVRGYNGTIENFVVLSETEYNQLIYKDPYKFYFTYEDGAEPTPDLVAYVEGSTLVVVEGSESDSTLNLASGAATYDSGLLTINTSSGYLSQPVFSPIAGTYDGTKTVEITCQDQDATIRYTLDWSDPSSTSPIYSGPITLDQSGTIKAKAFKGGVESRTTTGTYDLIFPDTVEAPILYPAGGVFSERQNVSIICPTPGATIRYTLDGSEPNETSAIYIQPIPMLEVMNVLRVRGFKDHATPSLTTSGIYSIGPLGTVGTPVFSVQSGTYNTPQRIIIYTPTQGATIRYTLDGSEPTQSSSVYTGEFTINESITIKAKAFVSGLVSSNINTLELIINDTPTPPEPGDIEVIGNTIEDSIEGDTVEEQAWIIVPTAASVENKTLIFN